MDKMKFTLEFIKGDYQVLDGFGLVGGSAVY